MHNDRCPTNVHGTPTVAHVVCPVCLDTVDARQCSRVEVGASWQMQCNECAGVNDAEYQRFLTAMDGER